VAGWSKGGGTVELTKEAESGGNRFRKSSEDGGGAVTGTGKKRRNGGKERGVALTVDDEVAPRCRRGPREREGG
jgi:hypothetical protein